MPRDEGIRMSRNKGPAAYWCFDAIFTLSVVGVGLAALVTMAAVATIAPGGPSSVTRTDPPKGAPPGGLVRNWGGIWVVSIESTAPGATLIELPGGGRPGKN